MPTAQQEHDKQPRRRKSHKPARKPRRYSKRDHEVFELIKAEKFNHMANDALYRQFRHRLETKLDKDLSYNAFRLLVNRIRRHHGFPTSERLKKSV